MVEEVVAVVIVVTDSKILDKILCKVPVYSELVSAVSLPFLFADHISGVMYSYSPPDTYSW